MVVFPRHVEEVLAVLDVARATGTPLTARGAGTSIAGNAIGEGIVLEPAGALAIDALRDLAAQGRLAGRRVVCICSGGNFDFERLPEVRERAQRWAGLKKYFILRLAQRPGALREFLNLLGPEDDIARFEYLKKSARNFGSVLIGIETTSPANLDALSERLAARGFDWRDITGDPVLSEFLI